MPVEGREANLPLNDVEDERRPSLADEHERRQRSVMGISCHDDIRRKVLEDEADHVERDRRDGHRYVYAAREGEFSELPSGYARRSLGKLDESEGRQRSKRDGGTFDAAYGGLAPDAVQLCERSRRRRRTV